MIGVAPDAKVMSVSTELAPNEQFGKGLRYLVDHGAKVVNMSLNADTPGASDIAYAESHDVVLVVSTGNEAGNPPANPATQFGVVSVSGVLRDLTVAPQASYGPPQIEKGANSTTGQLQGTAVAGPFDNTDGGNSLVAMTTVADGVYTTSQGTSGAAAIVSGIVALIRAAHPSMNAANVINRLIHTASLLKHSKVSPKIGFGVPDAYAAVSSASIKTVCENPLGSQATKSLGAWPAVLDSTIVYKPKCSSKGSSSSPSSTSSGASSPVSSAASGPAISAPAQVASAQAASAGGTSGGGVPAWVYFLIAVVVLVAIGLVLLLRGRGKRGGPSGPPGGGYGPPPSGPPGGGYGPPPGGPGPYGGPPQGGWQQGPPPQGGWRPGP